MENENIVVPKQKQRVLGTKGLITFIVLMNMFIPLSTDLYLPALPKMSQYFGSSATLTNLTLSIFFIFYALGILLWGPISDKYGRKKIILAGSFIYIASSIASALSTNVYALIIARLFQGLGSGGITSSSMAIIKDCFDGKRREKILAITQSISGLAPMLAPVIGAFILTFTEWRGTFWTLAGIATINVLLAIFYEETLKEEERYTGTVYGSLKKLWSVGKNKSFILPTFIFALSSLPFMGYIAVSSFVYVDHFGLSEQSYSFFFAANACISILGPWVYIRFFSNMNKQLFVFLCFGTAVASGLFVLTIGTISPLLFLLSVMLMTLVGTTMRPFSMNILFNQQKGDAGTTASLINTTFTLFGSIGMALASLSWRNLVTGLGIIMTISALIAIIAWYTLMKSSIPLKGVKNDR